MIAFLNSMLGGATQGIIWGIMALGVYLTFRILDFADMTVDGSFALGGATSAIIMTKIPEVMQAKLNAIVQAGGTAESLEQAIPVVINLLPYIAILAALLVGSLAGLITGLLNTKLKIPGILAGILMMLALYSTNLHIMGNKSNLPLNSSNLTVMDHISKLFKLSGDNANTISSLITGLVVVAIVIGVLYWFFGTELGSAIRATGDNPHMSRAQGISTNKMKILSLMIANALVSLSGALVMQQVRVGDVGMGIGAIVIGLASIIIGEVICGKRFGFWWTLLSVIIGSIIYRLIIAIVLWLGMPSSDMKLISAIVVAIALSVPVLKKKIDAKKRTVVTPPNDTYVQENVESTDDSKEVSEGGQE